MWEPVMDRLAEEREVIAVDMPGFGSSPELPAGREPSPANLARAAIDFYDTLGIGGDPHVCGISLGGWVAVECARLGRARSVTGLCSAGFWRAPPEPRSNWLDRSRAAGRALLPLLPLLLRTARGRRRALAGSIHRPERLTPDQALRLARGYIVSPAYPEASRLRRGDVCGAIDVLGVPVTLAWGQLHRLVRRPPTERVPEGVRQLELPGCGHVPTWDAPDLVARVILAGSDLEAASERVGRGRHGSA